ncbi:MAG: VOC family protein [Lysobacter sp.]|nr:VOC family protein [Lysobacter sp.]
MPDHIGFTMSGFERSKAFYLQAPAPLGIGIEMEVTPEATGGHARHAVFGSDEAAMRGGQHAPARATGGIDNGAPGLRPHSHPGHRYGACVRDPDGHDIEAVRHPPE